MAKLSANGTEVYRLARLSKIQPEAGTCHVILSIRSNLAVLQTTQHVVNGRRSTTQWKRAVSATRARSHNLTTAEALRDHFLKSNFKEIPTVGR